MRMKTMQIKNVNENSETLTISGMATTYGNKDRDGDIIEKGAFINFKDATEVSLPLLYNHDPNKVIGKITLTDKAEGVEAVADFCEDLALAKDVYKLVKFGAIGSMSIGFIPLDASLNDSDDVFGGVLIKQAELLETSIVPIPANPEAKITAVKSLGTGAIQFTIGEEEQNTTTEQSALSKYKAGLLAKI